jgi:hypothetical protein
VDDATPFSRVSQSGAAPLVARAEIADRCPTDLLRKDKNDAFVKLRPMVNIVEYRRVFAFGNPRFLARRAID